MPTVHVTARTDGTGTFQFGEFVYYSHSRVRSSRWDDSWGTNRRLFTLENIPDVARGPADPPLHRRKLRISAIALGRIL